MEAFEYLMSGMAPGPIDVDAEMTFHQVETLEVE